MEPKVIFRVESRLNGLGPYQHQKVKVIGRDANNNPKEIVSSSTLATYLWGDMRYNERHPNPDEENFKNCDYDIMYFGFNSLDQIYAWFSHEDLKRVDDFQCGIQDYAIAVYVSEYYDIGEKQCIFDKEEAVLVTWLECDVLAQESLVRNVLNEDWIERQISNYKEKYHE
ncbi:hypothetical protein HWC21_gp111 [Vibrio phage VAP7]|uniref:Uncharacterized protein n=3 Tax=root TaxID=1 RepID=A0A4Y5TV90_9CAUD|nr:hypothetical protein HWC21_gp111 [Vibrio phage VAP7]AWY10119.1 hypothetical protein [Vibrio phage VP-1]QDB73293.1 hypothetical protein [Vibrio phage VAP7]UFD98022.1 hypothetical protein [Vibrio phage BX-1]